ncbi:hypothetical protein DdX_00293 [Ditylenchus destructor]|uniref:Uncharacterized protein n=1 Tax=Ditylenchus destructor TaxID=166010 RepID=A0AAD4RCU6_9BILA|nr:hypothetical protein DdX_00293 [Ditylenchus destructor]
MPQLKRADDIPSPLGHAVGSFADYSKEKFSSVGQWASGTLGRSTQMSNILYFTMAALIILLQLFVGSLILLLMYFVLRCVIRALIHKFKTKKQVDKNVDPEAAMILNTLLQDSDFLEEIVKMDQQRIPKRHPKSPKERSMHMNGSVEVTEL